jgi:single-stranded-DNA-specific exonuclease
MKILQKGEMAGDIISTTLQNRNIDNIELFLQPDNSMDSDPKLFTKAGLGHERLMFHIKNKSTIVILVDADADGYTSSAIMYQYILDVDHDAYVNYVVHENKAHGLTEKAISEILSFEPNLVIIPDAGSNDIEQLESLSEKQIETLVIDHHVVTEFTEDRNVIVINNQLCDNTNGQLVGAGVVYKFLQGLDIMNNTNYVEKYKDLVAVGQIGDSSDIADIEIRNLVLTGLEKINNKFLKEAISQKVGLFTQLAPKDLSFSAIPLINSVTRVGTLEEREILFEALAGIGSDRKFNVVKRKKNKETGKFEQVPFEFNLYQYAVDVCSSVKARQDNAVKKMVASIEQNIVDDTGIIIAYSDNNENPGLSGLVANKLVSKYDKPALLLNEQETTFTGSGRGKENVIADFRKWCEDSGLVEFAQGHDNAFGICISKENMNLFKEYTRKIEKQEVIYEVDILARKPNTKDCELVYKNKSLFGGSVSEPFIGIENMNVPKRFITIKGNMLQIYSWGMKLVQFAASRSLLEKIELSDSEELFFNIVGYYSMNNWNNRLTPQLIIKDIELIDNKIEEEVTVENIIF